MDIIETIEFLKRGERNLLDTTLNFIRRELSGTLLDVAKIHLISAEQAFMSAASSNDSNTETRVGLGHLRDAFNAYQVYLDKGDTFLWIFNTSWDPVTRTAVELKKASIAFVIALVYEKLKDYNNYIVWKKNGIDNAKNYISNRATAISYWKNAKQYYDRIGIPDVYRRRRYREEIVFIELFSGAIKNV